MERFADNTRGPSAGDDLRRYLQIILRRVMRSRGEREKIPLGWLMGSISAGRDFDPDIEVLGQELAAAIRLAPADTWLRAFQRPQQETDQKQRFDFTRRANENAAR